MSNEKPASKKEKIIIGIGFILLGALITYLIDMTNNACIIWCFLK